MIGTDAGGDGKATQLAVERKPGPKQGPGDRRALILSSAGGVDDPRASIFGRLTESERLAVAPYCEHRLARRHSLVFRQGQRQDGIFIIQSGGVRVFFEADTGRRITRAIWFTGHFIGGPDVFGHNPHMWSGIAIRDTSLVFLPTDTLQMLCGRIPNLALGLIDALAFKGRCYAAMSQALGTRSASERISGLLEHLGELYGVRTEHGLEIQFPITGSEIADMVGVSRQWVTMGLKKLQAAGAIELQRGKITILDHAALAARS
ncbi:Crp/Fnr family transcriptional regulator [Methylopila musalis]|uniref:Crp/Fnr family transcriptional regulator n=1 Tax=Methylopila musalis TaxID=1134781 RepID=A0ABW3Z4N3_9HYPH